MRWLVAYGHAVMIGGFTMQIHQAFMDMFTRIATTSLAASPAAPRDAVPERSIPSAIVTQMALQFVIGIAATIPFIRQKSRETALFAVTFWLAGIWTVTAQPVMTPSGKVAGFLNGSVQTLLVYDVLVIAWGVSGTALYVLHVHPPDDPRSLRIITSRLVAGHGAVLFLLLALLPWASGNAVVLREGVWFPVSPGMSPIVALYNIIGKLYVFTLLIWAAWACWQVSRHLPHWPMRLGVRCGLCLAVGMIIQSAAVTVAQVRGQDFFATAQGRASSTLWLSLGFALPMGAFLTAGAVRRWKLFWTSRDLQSMTLRLATTVWRQFPERRGELIARSQVVLRTHNAQQIFEGVEEALPIGNNGQATAAVGNPIANTLRTTVSRAWSVFTVPVADVDRLAILLQDILRTYYPFPGVAAVLAVRWLWHQPEPTTAEWTERDIAILLLAITIVGGDAGIFDDVPLEYPLPLTRTFPVDMGWGYPASAALLRATWRMVRGRRDRTLSRFAVRGFAETKRMLNSTTNDERYALVAEWLGEYATRGQHAHRHSRPVGMAESAQGSHEDTWWLPPNLAHQTR